MDLPYFWKGLLVLIFKSLLLVHQQDWFGTTCLTQTSSGSQHRTQEHSKNHTFKPKSTMGRDEDLARPSGSLLFDSSCFKGVGEFAPRASPRFPVKVWKEQIVSSRVPVKWWLQMWAILLNVKATNSWSYCPIIMLEIYSGNIFWMPKIISTFWVLT